MPQGNLSESETRKIYIDTELKRMGWKFDGTDADVWEEYEVNDMCGIQGQKGYADYVLFDAADRRRAGWAENSASFPDPGYERSGQ